MNSHLHGSGGAPPANDIVLPSHLPPGGTFETNAWRVHRYADSVTVTHLLNAGARGKKCLEVTVGTSYGRDLDLLDVLTKYLVELVAEGPQPETVVSITRDAPLLSSAFEVTVAHRRGVDVELGAVKIDSDLVKGHFSMVEFRVTVTALHRTEHGTIRQDSHLYNADKRSVPKAYRWARANAARIGSMTRSEIYNNLREAGARVSTWG
jgi:hypothetical protein